MALRSAEVAKNAEGLIAGAVSNAKTGVSFNLEVLKSLNGIHEQVNNVVAQMTQGTQQIAANAEKSASGAEELSGPAEELQRIVKTFRLNNKTSGTDRADAIHGSEETMGLAFARPIQRKRSIDRFYLLW